jgi:hypothetical protein
MAWDPAQVKPITSQRSQALSAHAHAATPRHPPRRRRSSPSGAPRSVFPPAEKAPCPGQGRPLSALLRAAVSRRRRPRLASVAPRRGHSAPQLLARPAYPPPLLAETR